jgi:Na+/H+-dicarboxylate symporter
LLNDTYKNLAPATIESHFATVFLANSIESSTKKSKMKSVFVFALFIAAALAAPQGEKDAVILQDTQEVRVDGYNFQ